MLIVSGWLRVEPSERDAYLAGCVAVVEAARASDGCLDFSIGADVADDARITVHERWESEEQLLAFRGSGPEGEQQAQILDADVRRYEISGEGPA